MPSFQFVPGPTNLTPILKALYPPFSPIKQINLLQIRQTNKRNLSRPDQTQNFYLALETFSTAKLKICDTGFFEPEIFSIIDFTLDSSPPIPGWKLLQSVLLQHDQSLEDVRPRESKILLLFIWSSYTFSDRKSPWVWQPAHLNLPPEAPSSLGHNREAPIASPASLMRNIFQALPQTLCWLRRVLILVRVASSWAKARCSSSILEVNHSISETRQIFHWSDLICVFPLFQLVRVDCFRFNSIAGSLDSTQL